MEAEHCSGRVGRNKTNKPRATHHQTQPDQPHNLAAKYFVETDNIPTRRLYPDALMAVLKAIVTALGKGKGFAPAARRYRVRAKEGQSFPRGRVPFYFANAA